MAIVQGGCEDEGRGSFVENLSRVVFWVTFLALSRRAVYDYHLFGNFGVSDSGVNGRDWRHNTRVILMAGLYLGLTLWIIGFIIVDECGQVSEVC